METPYQNHIDKAAFDCVYEPAEDSFLLIDALEADLENLKALQPLTCVEIGSGSGIVITAFRMAFPSCFCYATDINPKACDLTLETAKFNKVNLDVMCMDFLNAFMPNKFDVILFNPPYVVTESSEIGTAAIVASWAGGIKGREVIDRLLPTIPDKLSLKGVFYLLLIEENIPNEVIAIMKHYKFHYKLIITRRVKNEKQLVLKFYRNNKFVTNKPCT